MILAREEQSKASWAHFQDENNLVIVSLKAQVESTREAWSEN